MNATQQGALVTSLDFELHWGVRDHQTLNAEERGRLIAARETVPGILRVFSEHNIRATWATVGLLFARSREEAQAFRPRSLPKYQQSQLDPYAETLGQDEADDPFHFAPSLIRAISQVPGQELGSHSYSHYYSLEAGQGQEDFKADLASAKGIAENSGYRLKSYVFPRNQVRRTYLPILQEAGFCTYRGTEPVDAKSPVTFSEQRQPWRRALRLIDAYSNLHGVQTVAWPTTGNLLPVDASRYLRPFSPALRKMENARLKRIAGAMKSAAEEKRIFHLWWHPEDFAKFPAENLDFLARVLRIYGECRREYGMLSLSMGDVSDALFQTAPVFCGGVQ
jgi:peptidoglycan/xylan/chitin deacetylase (PgdA/CDA1 family)